EGIDYRQQEVLSVTNPVPGTSWYMVTKVDKDEIFEDLYFRSALITAITILLIFITGATLAWFYLYRQRNLYKMLLDKELQLHQSQQEFHATIYSMGDGVITTNNQGLVQQMNPVAERLTGWQESEAKGQNIEEIFRIINEDTLSKVENPVSKVLIEGSIVNLANHTLLISKDGKEIPISDSGAPIKDKKGRVIGVVLIFKDQTEERAQENALKESQERFQQLFINAPLGYQSLDNNGKFLEVNQQWLNTLGYSKDEIIGKNFSTFIAPEHQDIFSKQFQTLKDQGHIHSEFEMLHKNGEKRIIALDGRIGYSKAGEFIQSHCIIQDITEKKKTEKDLKNIEWMLTRQPEMFEESESMSRQEQSYGNLTLLNKGGLIKSSIDQSILHGIVNEYMILLETSSAIYEKNGDYAYGIFSSGWCQLMDQSSRNLCNTKNNAEALVSGKWLCHDSCWKDCSLKAIESEKPADIECNGGIHLYGVPIFANGEVVGVINFGYGNPPKDIDKLKELAKLYNIDVSELKKKSEEYYSRPAFIVEIAKKRIKVSAKIIGMLIERKLAENSLRESEAKFRSLIESTPVGILLTDKNHRTLNVNKKFSETTGYTLDDIPTADDWWQKAYPDKVYRQDLKNQWDAAIKEALKTNSEIKPVETKVTCKSGTEKYFKIGSVNVGNINIVTFTDITEHKYHELEIKTSREFILSIIENLPIGLAVNTVEPNISFEFMNDNFARFYNLSKEELANPNAFWDTVYEDPKFREKIKNRILTDIKTGDPEKMKWTDIPIKRDGEIIRYVTARNIPLHDRGLVISTVWDVTERKMAEMEFVKLKDNLEVLVKEKTKELNERVAELERFHEATINREIRMKELKDEIKRLKNEQ
ncbi:MAG: PAS domain S-box protein, partial [Perlabentimonas sp.]